MHEPSNKQFAQQFNDKNVLKATWNQSFNMWLNHVVEPWLLMQQHGRIFKKSIHVLQPLIFSLIVIIFDSINQLCIAAWIWGKSR